jgi:hypothetical protein
LKTCMNCKHLRWGWYIHAEDECDYTCELGDARIFLLCVHGKTDEEIKKEFKQHAEKCRWYEEVEKNE